MDSHYPALHGLIDQLPSDQLDRLARHRTPQTWTSEHRNAFLTAFTQTLDFSIAVDDSPPEPEETP